MVHEYYRRQFEGFKILVQLNPASLTGLELTIADSGQIERRKMHFDEDIWDDLQADGFESASPLEFNLYLKGLA